MVLPVAAALQRLLPARPEVRALALADLIGAFGRGAFVAGSAVFFTRSVGLSAAEVGIGLSAAGGAGLAVAIPAGRLCDRLGPLRVMFAGGAVTVALFAAYALVAGFWQFLAVVTLLGVTQRLDRIAIGAAVAGLLERDDRISAVAFLRSVNNVGIAAGAGLAGAAIAIGSRPAYLALPLTCAVATGVMLLLRSRLPHVPPAPPRAEGESRWEALRDRPFVALTVLFGLARLDSAILDVGLPLWVVSHTAAPRPLVAWLLIVNTVLVILFQVRAARGSETAAGVVRTQRLASIALVGACLVFGSSGSLGEVSAIVVLVAGMVLLTAGELWVSAGGWSVRYGLAAPHAQGQYGAVFSLGDSAMDMVGPALVVVLTDKLGLGGWAILAGVFALLFVAVKPLLAWAGERPGMPAGPRGAAGLR